MFRKRLFQVMIPGLLAILPGTGRGSPSIRLEPGAKYFSWNGREGLLLGTNSTGWKIGQFHSLLARAAGSGERLVRIHLTNGRISKARAGNLDEDWARFWESVLDQCRALDIAVIPVFDAWAWWNEAGSGESQRWRSNPYNQLNGGPAKRPSDLLRDGSTKRLYLGWLGGLVRRWSGRPEIVAWELFSELDLVTGADETLGAAWFRDAALAVRAADPERRPLTASLSGNVEWPTLFQERDMDIVQVHPYANLPGYDGNLDMLILDSVRSRLKKYGKPVLIGECGLSSNPLGAEKDLNPRRRRGLEQAIWAQVVSGDLAARMLWYEDGYDIYSGWDLHSRYDDLTAPMAAIIGDLSFSGMAPLDLEVPEGHLGAALGNDREAILWVRDSACVSPTWTQRPVPDTPLFLRLPGPGEWRVDWYNVRTGKSFQSNKRLTDRNGITDLATPEFEGSVFARLTRTDF